MSEMLQDEPKPVMLSRADFARLVEDRVEREFGIALPEFVDRIDTGNLTAGSSDLAILVGAHPSQQ